MGVVFSDAVIESHKGPRRALVITPTQVHRVGRETLERLRASGDEGPIERSIVDYMERASEPYPFTIFRGQDEDGTVSWGLEEGLDQHEAHELARRLILSHLATHRCLLRAGTYVMVHTDFDSRDALVFRRASEELAEERARTLAETTEPTAEAQADLWILRHYNFYFSLGYEKVLANVLPDRVPLIELRQGHIESLARALAN